MRDDILSAAISAAVGCVAFALTRRLLTSNLLQTRSTVKHAICQLGDFGSVRFSQLGDNQCKVQCELRNLPPGNHGLHVHEYGDLTNGCHSTCSHYNPTGQAHGGPRGLQRHRGDLGNVYADASGRCNTVVLANINVNEIVGRALILHEGEDDLGVGQDDESRKTGNAGARMACGVIGLMKA